jgi:hypothetical protein
MTTEFSQAEYEEFFEYLDTLRASGTTNMYGASPFVADQFGLDKREAKTAVMAWMNTFGDGSSTPKDRAKKAIGLREIKYSV